MPAHDAAGGIPVLRLSAPVAPGAASAWAGAVLALMASPTRPGTVALELTGNTGLEPDCWRELCSLHDCLLPLGTRLRLAIVSRRVRDLLPRSALHPRTGRPVVHESLRSAVLAAYAEQPGPGLVTGQIRAELDRPPLPLHITGPRPCACFTPTGWGAAASAVGGLDSP